MNQPNFNPDEVKGYEVKHVTYTRSNNRDSNDDALIIKKIAHMKNGDQIPFLDLEKNYKRTFYLERNQNYSEKKTQQKLRRLQQFTCTQRNLIPSIGRALGRGSIKGGLRTIARNPFLYGTDITSATLYKQDFRKAYPDCNSPNRVAVFDIETDVVNGDGSEPICMSLTFKDKVFLVVTKKWIGTIQEFEKKAHAAADKYLSEHFKARNITMEVMVVDTPGQAVVETFKRAHEWKPDFVSVWNINFDLPKCLAVLQKEGIDPAQVFSDPSVPEEFKFFRYKEGNATKVTATGRVDSIHPAERWHVAECPATFFLIDSMCVYKRIRMAKQNEPSYGLDAVMKKNLKNLGKLKFAEADAYSGLQWHIFMQDNYKVEYSIYNVFDCIGVEILDEKIKDLQLVISTQSKASEYTIYNSQPKRLVDDFYFFCLERDFVLGSCSDEMAHEYDQYVTDMKGWIVTLPSHQTVDNGIAVLEEMPDVRTYIRTHVADLDIVSTYPNVQVILNISRETTRRELYKIAGIDVRTQRMAGINLTGGHVNAVEIACSVYQAPNFDMLLKDFEEEQKAA